MWQILEGEVWGSLMREERAVDYRFVSLEAATRSKVALVEIFVVNISQLRLMPFFELSLDVNDLNDREQKRAQRYNLMENQGRASLLTLYFYNWH